MPFDLDLLFDRQGSGSKKWSLYPDDVLPMWVADMDFAMAPAIVEALRLRLEHPLMGYSVPRQALRDTLVAYLWDHYAWRIQPDDLVFLPGVEPGVNMALNALVPSGASVVVQTPNYQPLRVAPGHWELPCIELPFQVDANGDYPTDLEALKRTLHGAGAFLFSNPHNPLGKVFASDELHLIGQACVEAGVLIISDEIHADILFDGRRHVPMASLSPPIAAHTITLMSASKAYNIAGLKTAFAVIQNPALRQRFNAARLGMVDSVNALGLEATRAAYGESGEWLNTLLAYLQANRDYLVKAVSSRLPGVRMSVPQGTYLAWLDCTALGLDNPQQFFLEHGRVAFSAGPEFGPELEQFVRLNFGCPRALLEEGLCRMERALTAK
ncbi:PatB family C-S lyase [Pseudomonas sp. dw_358]|uniref:MalY/PatB family protein n=1 Tax=Pseudomonas sp. dw_358 TaxID=2720083 RepID=UPI001BD44CF4|nr:PatB family C-S lyase [Pseudomonas sp. dw_358]